MPAGGWRARQACKRWQADAEPCAGTSTHPLVSASEGHERVHAWGRRAEILAKKNPTPNPSVIAPASSRPGALLLCCSPWPCLPSRGDQVRVPPCRTGTFFTFSSKMPPVSVGERSEAVGCSYVASETSLFSVLFCSAGAVLARWCQRLCSAWAEHRVGTGRGRKRLQKASLHVLHGRAVLAGFGLFFFFPRSEALLAAAALSHLLQLHLFGDIFLGMGLAHPPLLPHFAGPDPG